MASVHCDSKASAAGRGAPVVLVAGDNVHNDAVRVADRALPHPAQQVRLSIHELTAGVPRVQVP